MALLGEGDVFGEMAALDGTPRSADVVALTSLTVVKLRAAPFSDLLHQNASLALALARLEAEGHEVVAHVHDEIVVETEDPDRALEDMRRIMCTPANWAGGLPLNIEAHAMTRYGKG
jgi:hypothetical protein